MPDPLHPAVVHFPVVLLLLGCPLAVLAILMPRLAPLAAAVLFLGALGSLVAVQTGETEKRDEIAVPEGKGREVLSAHKHAGESARNAALAAAACSIGAAVARKCSRKRIFFGLAALAAAGSILAAWQVVSAGKTGGELVYHHGVGLRF